jgi:predicted SprT family Zn-dependent metalloprotease
MSLTIEHVERKLSERSGFRLQLIINENRSDVLAILDRGQNWAKVSMHRMFLEAPENVIDAVANYVQALDKSAFSVIRTYISENFHRFDYSHRIDPRNLETRGKFYDLQKIYDQVNQEYFERQIKLKITWLNRIPKKSCSRIIYGQYFQALRLIKINRLLDDPAFPEYFVAYVIYHEMLHHVVPYFVDEKGLTRIHSKEFKEREKLFRHYRAAKDWEQEFRYSFFAELN